MVRQYGFHFDAERCVQCHACETACKSKNNIEPGVNWRSVIGIWKGRFPDVTSRTYSIACNHCADPPCRNVCPANVIKKRREDGIVTVNRDKCIGCRSCLTACPFGAPQFGADGFIQKCNMCVSRIDEGKEPACAATCPVTALTFGTLDSLTANAREKSARRLAYSKRAVPFPDGECPA